VATSWLTPDGLNIVLKLLKAVGWKKPDLEKLESYVSDGQLYLLRYINACGRPLYPHQFSAALAKWNNDNQTDHKGWQKAAEYACFNLVTLGLLKTRISAVEVSTLGKAFLEDQQGKKRAKQVFDKTLPRQP